MYNTNSKIKFKTSMLKSNLCEYSDAYVLVNATIIITVAEANNAGKRLSERNIGAIFKKCE